MATALVLKILVLIIISVTIAAWRWRRQRPERAALREFAEAANMPNMWSPMPWPPEAIPSIARALKFEPDVEPEERPEPWMPDNNLSTDWPMNEVRVSE